MRINPILTVVTKLVALLLAFAALPAFGCLRDSLDDRAVQWSSLIVMAKLSAIHDPQALSDPYQYQLYDFQITSTLDGSAKAGDTVHVVRFISGANSQKSSICGQAFTDKQIGKEFLLLLCPEADLRWSESDSNPDPRTSQLHDLKAFVVVHLDLAYDLGSEGLDDAKYEISNVRAAEAQFKPDDAKLQVQTMINAADDTEESQAEQAIQDMGPKAIPTLRDALASADDDAAKARVNKMIRALSPPSLLTTMHGQ
jgi:hypothetical protein